MNLTFLHRGWTIPFFLCNTITLKGSGSPLCYGDLLFSFRLLFEIVTRIARRYATNEITLNRTRNLAVKPSSCSAPPFAIFFSTARTGIWVGISTVIEENATICIPNTSSDCYIQPLIRHFFVNSSQVSIRGGGNFGVPVMPRMWKILDRVCHVCIMIFRKKLFYNEIRLRISNVLISENVYRA